MQEGSQGSGSGGGNIRAKFNNFMIYARRHKIAILSTCIIILLIIMISLSVAVGQIYNELFYHRSGVNASISDLDIKVKTGLIDSGTQLIENNNTTIEKINELRYKYGDFKTDIMRIENKLELYKKILSKNISNIIKIIANVERSGSSYKKQTYDNITSLISQITGRLNNMAGGLNNTNIRQILYKKATRSNITSLIEQMNINKKLNYNNTKTHEKDRLSTIALRKTVLNIQTNHDSLNLNITKLKEYVDEFTTGYKVFFKKCPQNWTMFGFLKPIYICYK